MNMLPDEAINFIMDLQGKVKNSNKKIIICAPFTDLFYTINAAQETNIHVGAQNMYFEDKGAFTGEVSGEMLKSINCEYVILGHSERRKYFNETDEIINKKVKAALRNSLKPIVCVGETLEQKEANKTLDVIINQISNDFKGLTTNDLSNIIVAYEPVWAIGTGKTATKEEANNSIKAIRDEIRKEFGTDDISILYGGSVKKENASELFNMPDIDGGLIGGASLKSDDFAQIVNS